VTAVTDLLSRLPGGAERTRVAAFRALRRGEAPGVEELARDSGLGSSEVRGHLGAMAAIGMARLDESGRVTASDGLSLMPTRHRLVLEGVVLHTWCAIDAVGIPAALGADAVASTPCPQCGRRFELRFRQGELHADEALVAWAPGSACSNIVEEFCPEANLFCHREHLEAWRGQAGNPPGEILTVGQVLEQGRRVWGPLRGER
jgi:DNA-binding transcriptional ArsR family regulator